MAADRSLHIAWLGAGPSSEEVGGVPGVAAELLAGLAERGHRIDCFLPGATRKLPDSLGEQPNLTFVWGTSEWRWNRWYNRVKIGAFLSGMVSRARASLRLRREVAQRHRQDPYDLVYQFSNIEVLAMPAGLRSTVPLVIHPETHIAGELKSLIAERRLALRSQPPYTLAITGAVMSLRALVQRVEIRRARLLICISSVFRDHLVRDYGFPPEKTVVIPNPVRLERFRDVDTARGLQQPPNVLVLGRIAARKGVEDVVAVAHTLLEQGSDAHIRVVGGPSLWSDYTKLLDGLPSANAEYAGRIPPTEIPDELAHSDILLQASKYEPFGLTVGEALAAGVPVVATSEVGAIEGVDSAVVGEACPGDVPGIAAAVTKMLARLHEHPGEIRSKARAEAQRLFAPAVVCEQISDALERLVVGGPSGAGSPERP
jgi:glycosyltransferase involved in cell wall biosynthesis